MKFASHRSLLAVAGASGALLAGCGGQGHEVSPTSTPTAHPTEAVPTATETTTPALVPELSADARKFIAAASEVGLTGFSNSVLDHLKTSQITDRSGEHQTILVTPDNTKPALSRSQMRAVKTIISDMANNAPVTRPRFTPLNSKGDTRQISFRAVSGQSDTGYMYIARDPDTMPSQVSSTGEIRNAVTFKGEEPPAFSFLTRPDQPRPVTALKHTTDEEIAMTTELINQQLYFYPADSKQQSKIIRLIRASGTGLSPDTIGAIQASNSLSRFIVSVVEHETYHDYVASATARPVEELEGQGIEADYTVYGRKQFGTETHLLKD